MDNTIVYAKCLTWALPNMFSLCQSKDTLYHGFHTSIIKAHLFQSTFFSISYWVFNILFLFIAHPVKIFLYTFKSSDIVSMLVLIWPYALFRDFRSISRGSIVDFFRHAPIVGASLKCFFTYCYVWPHSHDFQHTLKCSTPTLRAMLFLFTMGMYSCILYFSLCSLILLLQHYWMTYFDIISQIIWNYLFCSHC